MTRVTIYHNPKCSKSRQTLALLRERGLEPKIILYLETPPSTATLKTLLRKLGLSARELVRRKEFREAGLPPSDDEATLLQAMAEHPQLIERPIVVVGQRACLGRPPENVLELLDSTD